MNQMIGQISLVVRDYDEAIRFYVDKLGFTVLEDTRMSSTKRWVIIRRAGNGGCNLLLARAADERQTYSVGNQTGGRVFLFLYTDDLRRDHQNLISKEIAIVREISEEVYGTVLVFADLYGNLWDLIQLKH